MAIESSTAAGNKDLATILDIKRRLSSNRWVVERPWWGNILFYMGHQWVIYDNNARRWRQRKLSPSVPTPVTNLFRATMDTVKSAVAQHSPRFIGTPSRDDPASVAAAGSVDAQLKIILKEAKFTGARRRMMDWFMLTGNAFVEHVYDESESTGMVQQPLEACQICGYQSKAKELDIDNPGCPKCGSPYLAPSADQFEEVPSGRFRYDVLSPFEVHLDPIIEELEDQPYVLVIQSFTPEQIKLAWDVDIEKEGGAGSVSEISMMHREGIASVAVGGVATPFGTSGMGERYRRVVVYRLFVKYHKDYPNGAYIVMTAGGTRLEKKTEFPWKRQNGKGQMFYPLTHYRFATIPGRAWGFSPADDLLPKQYQLNKAESLVTLICTRMANPVWLIPTNTNPTRITGEIGIQIEYTPVGQQAPSRVPGSEAPQSLVKYIADIRQSFDELSGAFAAVRGRSMGSRTPVGTVQALQERGFGRWATVFQGLEEGYQDLAEKSLEIWRQKAHTPRVQAIKDAVGGYTFQEFLGADWDDGVDVQVEAGSTRPHTQQEKLTAYIQLAQIGVLDFMDEAQKIKMLEDTGFINMRAGVEEDSKCAYKENAEFMKWAKEFAEKMMMIPPDDMDGMERLWGEYSTTPPIMVTPIVDDHAVHFLTHRRLALTEDFKALPEPVKQFFYVHMMSHQVDMMASKALKIPEMASRNAGVQGAMGAGKPGAPPGGGSAHQGSTKEINGGESNPDGNE